MPVNQHRITINEIKRRHSSFVQGRKTFKLLSNDATNPIESDRLYLQQNLQMKIECELLKSQQKQRKWRHTLMHTVKKSLNLREPK